MLECLSRVRATQRRISAWLPEAGPDYSAAFEPYRDDFPAFCKLLSIRTKEQGLIPFDPENWHPEQWQFERERTGRDIVLKPRQIGFSTLELARDIWFALRHEGVQVVIVGQATEEVQDLFETIRIFAKSCADAGLCAHRRKKDNAREVAFAHNHSSVRVKEAGATEKTAQKRGRSGTGHRIHATEVAFWGAAEATMTALIDSAPKDGEIVVESTANGVGGLFHSAVTEAQEERGRYKLHFFPWYQHPEYRLPAGSGGPPPPEKSREEQWEKRLISKGCDEEQLAWWRTKVRDKMRGGLEKALQEHPIDINSAFRSPEGRYLDPEVCDWLDQRTRPPIRLHPLVWEIGVGHRRERKQLGSLRVYEEPQRGRRYVVGGDVSEGIGSDSHAAVVLDWRTGEPVAAYDRNDIEAADFGLALALIGRLYNDALLAPERENDGKTAVAALIREARYPESKIYHAKRGRPGWSTNPPTRPVLFGDLHQALTDGATSTPDATMASQARTLVKDDRGRPAALRKGQKGGASDDLIVAWGIAWQVRRTPPTQSGQRIRITGAGFTT